MKGCQPLRPPKACAPSNGRDGDSHVSQGSCLAELRLLSQVSGRKPKIEQSHQRGSILSSLRLSFFGLVPHSSNRSFYTNTRRMKLIVGFHLLTSLVFCFFNVTTRMCACTHIHGWGVSRVYLEPHGAMGSYSIPNSTSPGTTPSPQWNSAL